jgi:hypothetical protein
VDAFITVLGHLLPCSYCRASYGPFVTNLGAPSAAMQANELPLWMYNLHNLVNAKLGKTACTPTLEHVRIRFAMQPRAWSNEDIFDMIALFGMNYQAENRVHYETWWGLLPKMVRMHDADLARQLESVPTPTSATDFVATAIVMGGAQPEHKYRAYCMAKVY